MTLVEDNEARLAENERLIKEQVMRSIALDFCRRLKEKGFVRREAIAVLHRAEEEILKDMF